MEIHLLLDTITIINIISIYISITVDIANILTTFIVVVGTVTVRIYLFFREFRLRIFYLFWFSSSGGGYFISFGGFCGLFW